MIRLTPDELEVCQNVARQYPRFLELIQRWRMEELELLPNVLTGNVGVQQGRVQVLNDLRKALSKDHV